MVLGEGEMVYGFVSGRIAVGIWASLEDAAPTAGLGCHSSDVRKNQRMGAGDAGRCEVRVLSGDTPWLPVVWQG